MATIAITDEKKKHVVNLIKSFKAIDGAIKDGLGSIVSHVHPNPNDPHKICFVDCVHGLAD